MNDLAVRAYCLAHKSAKLLFGRTPHPRVSYGYAYSGADASGIRQKVERAAAGGGRILLNDVEAGAPDARPLFYGENALTGVVGPMVGGLPPVSDIKYDTPEEAWKGLINRSIVTPGWRNSDLHLVCFDKRSGQWCLSDWIWTSAAVARYLASVGDVAGLVRVANAFLHEQLPEGPWVVRFDYTGGRVVPTVAPNDSCYMAVNALLPAWRATGDERYLDAARRCADWVVETAAPTGLVRLGYDRLARRWVTDRNIVDTGFTAALFSALWEGTGESRYRDFLARFAAAYIGAFYDGGAGLFATGLAGEGADAHQVGGHFARGQAWALEGLIPAFRVLGDVTIREVIERVVGRLVDLQGVDGGWAYNLSRPLMGQDCKGTPVIARALAQWAALEGDVRAARAAARALGWCGVHTDLSGPCAGGIFSFCLEGAVTHYLYSSSAFVYASSYALETRGLLSEQRICEC